MKHGMLITMGNQDKELERVLKALANKRRLAILRYLKRHKEATVGEIAEAIHLSFKSTSRHLSVLAGANVVEKDQRSLEMWHKLSPSAHQIVKNICSTIL